jgi:hypothetical protein
MSLATDVAAAFLRPNVEGNRPADETLARKKV